MRLLPALSVLALAVGPAAGATAQRGTLTGQVTRGPVTPVCTFEQPCFEPAPNVMLVFTRDGAVVGRAITSRDGRYRLRLPVGSYGVRRAAASGPSDRKLEPNHVRVSAGTSTRVDFVIDTGIR